MNQAEHASEIIKHVDLTVPNGANKVLMHSCCAPCAGELMEQMVANGIDLTIFFYNPNIMPQPLTPMQEAKVDVAVRLFDRYVESDATVDAFEKRLRTYVAKHPDHSITANAIQIADELLAAPRYQNDTTGALRDVNFTIRAQFSGELAQEITKDPVVQRLQRAERAAAAERSDSIDTILAADPLINREMAVAAVDRIRTSLNNDTLEARALARAVNTLVHTTGFSAAAAAIEHGQNPATPQGRNAGRYQEAKEDIVELLKKQGITNPREADVTTIMNEALPMAREAIARHSKENDGAKR
jgi:hypothetical protein